MLPLHLFGQDNQNEVLDNILDLVMPLILVSVSHAANGVINGTMQLFRSR